MTENEKPGVRVVDRRWWARETADQSGADTQSSTKPTYVEDLEQRLADSANQLQTYITEHRRSLDEFEQVKVRIRRDVGREVERGKRVLLAELLEVGDNLDRAIAAARQSGSSLGQTGENLVRGVELVRDQFLAKLEAFGVRKVAAAGLPFDARQHEAVTTTAVASQEEDGKVVAVIKDGYAIGDEMLRPASVVVGRYEP